MSKLSKYDNTTVRITCDNGDVFTGACVWDGPEYNLGEYNIEKESLRIGEYIFFEDYIRKIELLRREACIPVRDWPEAKEEIAVWFHERWHVPLEAYMESITACLGNESGIPQWYVVVRGNRIIAGCGVIENDFHERKDLAPNVCAVYVDEEYRGQGIAGFLLQYVCEDMAAMGVDTLYLLTDHVGFYERYGWQFLCMTQGSDGDQSRVYVHHHMPANTDDQKATRKKLAAIAEDRAQIPFHGAEEGKGSNLEPIVKLFPGWTLEEADRMWCAAFVYYCCREAGFVIPIRPEPCHTCHLAGCIAWEELALGDSRVEYHKGGDGFVPEAGDIVIYDRVFENREHDHMGIVLENRDDSILVAEGNIDNRSGIIERPIDEHVRAFIRIPDGFSCY